MLGAAVSPGALYDLQTETRALQFITNKGWPRDAALSALSSARALAERLQLAARMGRIVGLAPQQGSISRLIAQIDDATMSVNRSTTAVLPRDIGTRVQQAILATKIQYNALVQGFADLNEQRSLITLAADLADRTSEVVSRLGGAVERVGEATIRFFEGAAAGAAVVLRGAGTALPYILVAAAVALLGLGAYGVYRRARGVPATLPS
jgi:hypothetical protein